MIDGNSKKMSFNKIKGNISSLSGKNFYIALLLIVIAMVLLLFLNKARIPFFLAISSREAQTASQARYFYNSGIDLLRPQYDLTPTPQYLAQEFPIYEAVVAVIYHIVGFHEVWGKYLSVLALIGSIIYIFLISNHYFKNKYVSVITAIIFAVAPYTIRFYPIFMIDPTTVFLSLVTLFHGIRWIENRNKIDYWAFFISGLIAFLIKFIFLIPVCVPLFVLFLFSLKAPLRNEKKRIIQFFSAFICWGIFLLVWVIWSGYLNNQTTLQAFNDTIGQYSIIDKWFGTLDMRTNPIFLDSLNWISTAFVPTWISPWVFYGLLFIGLIINFAKSRRNFGILMASWAIGFGAILAVFFPALTTHIYYWLPAIPIAALLFASEIDFIFGFFADTVATIKMNSKYLKVFVFIFVLIVGEIGIIGGLHTFMKGFDLFNYRSPNQFDYFTGIIIFFFVSLLWLVLAYYIFYKQLPVKGMLSIFIIGILSVTFYSTLFYGSERYWDFPPDLGIHWSVTPLLLQEADYIKQNHELDKPIVIVTKYNYYPQILYLSNSHGYTLRYPENDLNTACVSGSDFPVLLSNPCVSLVHKQGIEDIFVIFYQKELDMGVADFQKLAPSLHIKLVDQMMPDDSKLNGNVLHYHIDLP